jgi:hypothetical protein
MKLADLVDRNAAIVPDEMPSALDQDEDAGSCSVKAREVCDV